MLLVRFAGVCKACRWTNVRRLDARVPLAGGAARCAVCCAAALVRDRVLLAGAVGGVVWGATLRRRRDLMRRARLAGVVTTLGDAAVSVLWCATLGSGIS